MPFATAPFMGKIRPVEPTKQWAKIRFTGDKFLINEALSKDFEKFKIEYEKFCRNRLKKIIENGINDLKHKKIKVILDYTDGKKTFPKEVKMSVVEYLKVLNFSPKIRFEMGNYEKEWGINQINPKEKNFVLFFNQNLIKYDSGQHIKHVVAHELAHVFIRNHGEEFHKVLTQLDSKKKQSEYFFSKGISHLFQDKMQSVDSKAVLIGLVLIVFGIIIYWLYNFILNFFNLSSQPNF